MCMKKTPTTRGLFFIHSTPKGLCQHIEWTLGHILGATIKLEWTIQPIIPNCYRTEYSWIGKVGTGAKIASALRGWENLRYEVTEEATQTTEHSRWSHTPTLGIFYAQTDQYGNMLVPENRIHNALENTSDYENLVKKIRLALGSAWDEELEPFRKTVTEVNIRWIHKTVTK